MSRLRYSFGVPNPRCFVTEVSTVEGAVCGCEGALAPSGPELAALFCVIPRALNTLPVFCVIALWISVVERLEELV